MSYRVEAYLIPSMSYKTPIDVDGISKEITQYKNDGIAKFFLFKEIAPAQSGYTEQLKNIVMDYETTEIETPYDIRAKRDDIVLCSFGRYKVREVGNTITRTPNKYGFINHNITTTIKMNKLQEV